jgi:diguanylate cyclase (GGDEF)-like protein
MTQEPPATPSVERRTERLEKRLERARLARHEAEQIAERTTRILYDKQQELVLLDAVVAVSNESSTLEEALQGTVDAVCAHTGWPVGHAYVRDPTSGDLEPTTIWHIEDSDRFGAFRRVTEQTSFSHGIGLPGRVLATGRAAWITDVTSDPNFPRRDLGVRGAFAFPIIVGSEIGAVLEYFTEAAVAPNPALLQGMSQIGRQVGRVVERIRAQEQIAHQAMHDGLTGLPNRFLFHDRVELALARSQRRGTFGAVLFLDLDRFKVVNDTLGHTVGDELLKDVSDRLAATLRASDTVARFRGDEFTLAHFGGDEFVVLCEDLASEEQTVRVAERIQQALLRPFSLRGEDYVVTASIGIALASAGEAEGVVRDAEAAMYRAKEGGPGRWELFDEALRGRALERLGMERALRGALESGELRLHYQPIVALDGGSIQGVEALVRWQHPERGLVLPGEFIPIAEESSLILQIGAWTLREACEQACRWRTRFGDRAPLPVSVNLSARQLAQAELPEIIRQVLADTGLSAGDLAIEITETALIENSRVPATSLVELKSLGVTILLDDFGTGYSSLSHLRRFPIDILKIDRSFVMHLGAGGDDAAIVQAIAGMAHALGLEVVTEGIESLEQAGQAQALGCGWAQGYYFARPGPPATIESLIHASSRTRPPAAPAIVTSGVVQRGLQRSTDGL